MTHSHCVSSPQQSTLISRNLWDEDDGEPENLDPGGASLCTRAWAGPATFSSGVEGASSEDSRVSEQRACSKEGNEHWRVNLGGDG